MTEAKNPDKGQATEGYIALCREANLQRLVQYGDYYLSGDGEDWRRGYFPVNLWSNKFPEYYREAYSTIRFDEHGHPAGDFLVWLPRLDQLLRLIEAEGWEWSIETYGDAHQGKASVWKSDGSVNPSQLYFTGRNRSAGSVESAPELMLRLLIKIRGHLQEGMARND